MKTNSRGKPLVEVLAPAAIKVKAFQAVSFYDPKAERQIIVLYSLGEDGIVRELGNNKWTPFPVTE